MSVIRVEKTSNYTVMSNYHFKEKEMSLKAKGLISLMLSLPDTWDYTVAGLITICKENETAITSALNELKEFGYLEMIKKLPNETKSGRIEYEYIVYEKPKKQEGKKQDPENLGLENQCIENPEQLNTNKLNTNNKINIDIYSQEELKKQKEEKILKANIKCIIDYLNETANTKYKYNTKETVKYIKARFIDGYVLDDFYDVIDKKWKDWKNTEWQKYMRPETLFGNKFESYLNESTFKGNIKTSYSSKPNFDNTSEHISPQPLCEMSLEEKENFVENELAKDSFGNLIQF